jgi:hypothetical protein
VGGLLAYIMQYDPNRKETFRPISCHNTKITTQTHTQQLLKLFNPKKIPQIVSPKNTKIEKGRISHPLLNLGRVGPVL